MHVSNEEILSIENRRTNLILLKRTERFVQDSVVQ